MRYEINMLAIFCAFCQLFTSYLLLISFLNQTDEEAKIKALEKITKFELEDNTVIVVKFICALLFHFKFESEIRNGLEMMKYAALHME